MGETKRKRKSIPASEWRWFGFSAHFICGTWCRFHMATQVGDYLISTLGHYVPPPNSGSERAEREFLLKFPNGKTIGAGKDALYETMVFKAGAPCTRKGCECAIPEIDGSEVDGERYAYPGAATKGHMDFCNKYAAIQKAEGN